MIEYIKGDLLKTEHNIILHGCNAQGVMGSGVAKAVRDKYPGAFSIYKRICDSETDKSKLLGRVVWYLTGDKKYIGNCITQEYYGRDNKQYVDYDAIRACLNKVNILFKHKTTIAMPRIGAGLGGGNWATIEQIINDTLERHTVKVYEL